MQAVIGEDFAVLDQSHLSANDGQSMGESEAERSATKAYEVLILEGNPALARLLASSLSLEKSKVTVTNEGASAMSRMACAAYDLVILDLDFPDVDGLKVIRELRSGNPEVQILALSHKLAVGILVNALDAGADDLMAKPFSILEMLARIRALRRRASVRISDTAPSVEGVFLHRERSQVERDGKTIDLTPREFTLLEYLMQNSGKTLSRALLTQEVWNMPAETNTNIVDVYIKYLRDKLDGDHKVKMIRTVRGVGYLFHAHA